MRVITDGNVLAWAQNTKAGAWEGVKLGWANGVEGDRKGRAALELEW